MRTIRRIYFYAVSLVSLEVALWGLIGLLRTVIKLGPDCTFSNLSLALALILVGAPLFAFHWWWSQRAARNDDEERSSLVRAGFLYGVLLAALIPAAQNVLALINRGLVRSTVSSVCQPLIGGQQTWPDNLVAILLNLAVAGGFYLVLRRDWQLNADPLRFIETRRLFRYVWVLYGLGLTVYGGREILQFLMLLPSDLIGRNVSAMLVDGAALILVGVPIWVYAWNACQAALAGPGEGDSRIRKIVLYSLALAGVPFALTMLDNLLAGGLRLLFGDPSMAWKAFLWDSGNNISVGIPFALVWAYYGTWLFRDIRAVPDPARRAEWRRPYLYILSAAGLVVCVAGLMELFYLLGSLLLFKEPLGMNALGGPLGRDAALLLVGLPVWLLPWGSLQAEALAPGEAGDHARRSLLRKVYLYVLAFAALAAGMVMTVTLLNDLLGPFFLKQPLSGNLFDLFTQSAGLVLFVCLLVYHLACLRRDGPRLGEWLAERQRGFAVLVLDPGQGGFAAQMARALQRQAPLLPVEVIPAGQAIPADRLQAAGAVLLPSSLLVDPPESLRRWLKKYPGRKILVADPVPGWTLGGLTVEQAARAAGQMAEGQEVRLPSSSPALAVFLYVILGLIGLFFLLTLISNLSF